MKFNKVGHYMLRPNMILHSVGNIYPHLNKRDNDKYL